MDDIRNRLAKARTALVLDHPFFGALSLRMEFVDSPAKAQSTMATDGRALYYAPDFIAGLDDAALVGLLAHEVMHCAMLHHTRRGNREHRKWNVACDFAINDALQAAGFTLPVGALLDPAYKGQSAEQIYGSLPDSNDDEQGGDGNGNGAPAPGGVLDAPEPADEGDWQVAVTQAVKAAQMMGNVPADIARLAKDAVTPRVDWKAVLRRFVQQCAASDYSWSLPNRRYVAAGLYLPALRSESMPPIVVAVDTSGSIDDAVIGAFAAELRSIVDECSPEATHVVYCDAAVQRVDTFARGDELTIDAVGGGGTDFRPVFDHVEREQLAPACVVYLTDGEGTYPDTAPDCPVLWAMTSTTVAPFGENVRLWA